ncbi:Replication factor A protein 1 [Serendipita sp. 399]|nr:Replication factor A protein 1 [Serendipita sp. 399]
MAEYTLTKGFCAKANQVASSDELSGQSPTLQLLSVKKIAGGAGLPDRYRAIISDGDLFMQAMLATTINHLVEDGTLRKHAVFRLKQMELQTVKTQRLLIMFDLDAFDYPEEKIGEPANVGKAPTAGDPMAVDKPISTASASNAGTSASTSSRPAPAPVPPRPAAPNKMPGALERAAPVFPIEGLNPYHNKWTIKVRVTQKSDKRKWSNAKGEGQLFSVNLMDETGEIKATAFNAGVDALYDRFEEGKVYYVSKGKVVLAKKAFSNLKCDYEINMDAKTEVEECMDTTSVPEVKYAFTKLQDLENVEKDEMVDVLVVVHKVSELSEIKTKQGKQLSKRELTLVDETGVSCQCTLWGKQAESWNHHDNPVVAFKSLKVGDFHGRSLSAFSSSTLQFDVDIPDAHRLRGWYEREGNKASFGSFSGGGGGDGSARGSLGFRREEVRTINDVRVSDLGSNDTAADFFNIRATIIILKEESMMYAACKGASCNKKVTPTQGGYFCEKCNQTWDQPEHRYLLGLQVADHTSQLWLQAFNDVGVLVLGMSADELNEIRERDEQEFSKVVHKAMSKTFNFSCRAKQDTYQDSTRVRYGINRAYPLDYAAETRNLHKMLSQYSDLIPARYVGV